MGELDIKRLFSSFDTGDAFVSAKAYGNGHINDTYRVTGERGIYTLQRINTYVFKDPTGVMENIHGVTSHIRRKYEAAGIDASRRTLRVIKTNEGGLFTETDEGVYRMFTFVDGAVTHRVARDPAVFARAAQAFGRFQSMLADYPAEKLCETIKEFHNTPVRYANFLRALDRDVMGRAASVLPEIEYVKANADFYSAVTDGIAQGAVPLRVTHNDTKLDNVLFDEETGEGICVIDLDTVMPGSMLYDYGDALRVGMNPAAEDEKDLSKVSASLPMYRAFTEGYLSELGGVLTERELSLMPIAGRLMTLECAMRFLTDYLEGDVYFKTAYEGQNLRRTRVGLKLAEDMRQNEGEMRLILEETMKKLGY